MVSSWHRFVVVVAAVMVVFVQTMAAQPPSLDPRVVQLVASVSAERLAADVNTLAGFGTRHLYSETASPTRGIGAAREWIAAAFAKAGPRLQVAFDTYQLVAQCPRLPREVELRNVVAVLPGTSPRRQRRRQRDGAGDPVGARVRAKRHRV